LNSPDWVWTLGGVLFYLVIFEIPSRIGPKPFKTFFSGISKFPLRDKLILILSFVMLTCGLIISDKIKDQLNWLGKLAFVAAYIFCSLGPIWFFGSQEARDAFFKKDNNVEPDL
jgi:hypothetical protein